MIRRAAAMSLLIMLSVLWVLPFAAQAESGVQTVRVGWYETPFNHRDAFDRRTVGEAEQVLAAAVLGDLACELGCTRGPDALGKRLAQGLREVGHLGGIGDALAPHPVLDLLGAERRLPELLHEREQLPVRAGMEVERGGGGVVKVLFCHVQIPSF